MIARIKARWGKIRAWRKRQWEKLKPRPAERRGFKWAVFGLAVWAAIVGGVNLRTGFGKWTDLAVAFAIAAVGIPLVAVVVAFVLTILRRLPRMITGFAFGAVVLIGLMLPPPVGLLLGGLLLLIEGLLAGSIALLIFGRFRELALGKRILTVMFLIGTIAANIFLYRFLTGDGTVGEIMRIESGSSPAPAALDAPDPSQPGPFAVKRLLYGSGNDLRRPEYGKSVAIVTPPLDASQFFKDWKGWRTNLRKRYWGFGMDQLPLNARVWYPDGPGPFPLALIVHGNHGMAEFSDPGYEYLGELLASRGFILASIDENFLNGGLFTEPPKQQAVRGWMLLEHLKLWHVWNKAAGNPFHGKVDVQNVALMGHSRGGEAAATAVLFNALKHYPDDATINFNYGFPIRAVVAIAPPDGQYRPTGENRIIENVSYFTIQGASDADVSSFFGSRQWERVRYRGEGDWFKSELYIYRANHGQFNTSWGRSDAGPPYDWFLNLKPLISGDDQRQIGKVYLSAFLEATLHRRAEYIPLFRDARRGRTWLPDTLYMSRYQDASFQVVSNFREDPDVTTTTLAGGTIAGENLSIWREGRIPFRRGDRDYNGVFLGWNREPEAPPAIYTITLPADAATKLKLSPTSALVLSLAVTDEKADPPGKKKDDKKKDEKPDDKKKPEPTDFTVEIESAGGVVVRLPLSQFGVLLPPFEMKFTKLAQMDSAAYVKASEPVFQTIELPLAAFAKADRRFDPAKVVAIRLRFDRTPMRVVILSQLGFEKLY